MHKVTSNKVPLHLGFSTQFHRNTLVSRHYTYFPTTTLVLITTGRTLLQLPPTNLGINPTPLHSDNKPQTHGSSLPPANLLICPLPQSSPHNPLPWEDEEKKKKMSTPELRPRSSAWLNAASDPPPSLLQFFVISFPGLLIYVPSAKLLPILKISKPDSQLPLHSAQHRRSVT